MSRPPLAGPLPLTLAWRLLVGPKSRLLGSTARAALLATALGVAALGLTLALLTGYREDLARRLVGGNAAILVYRAGGDEAALEDALAAAPEVRAVDRVRYAEGILRSEGSESEVTVRTATDAAGPFHAVPEELARREDGAWPALVGGELAHRLGVAAGDPLRLTVLILEAGGPRFAYRTLRVERTLETGFSEFDRSWLVVGAPLLTAVSADEAGIWELRLDDAARAPAVAERLRGRLGSGFLVLDWRELNRELFAALELQRRALFLLLGLIVLVATFNVASTLVVLVRERRRDFGVLAALGLSRRRIRLVFLTVGGLLGAAGAAIGLGVAGLLATLATRYEWLRFGPEMAEIYLLRSVPLRLDPVDAVRIAALAIAVSVAACWLPARRATRIEPAPALRFE